MNVVPLTRTALPAGESGGQTAPVPQDDIRRPYLRITALHKAYGDFVALQQINLAVYTGEFVCFLGPSGCGKTTLLRAIAGLEPQTAGRIEQAGRDISDLPVSARDFGIVFQSYALFPNLTAAQNIGYGLQGTGWTRDRIATRVTELLAMIGLPDIAKKFPAQLSGGQQQRVALARALALSPGLLLLDEPLSALDAKVRLHLRHEIRELQRRLGVTTIMVTHDQEEALAMADRIVVMNHGVIEQVGTPDDIYRRPASLFVAEFVGSMNFLPAEVIAPGRLKAGAAELRFDTEVNAAPGSVTLCLRPEDVITRNLDGFANRLNVTVERLEFLGSFCRVTLNSADLGRMILADLSANAMNDLAITVGKTITVALPPERIRLYPRTV